jgi:hypothetical protein
MIGRPGRRRRAIYSLKTGDAKVTNSTDDNEKPTDDLLESDEIMGLKAAVPLLRGRGGKPPSVETLRRWASPRHGYWPQGKGNGPPVLLRVVRVGGEMLTCRRWVQEFERERLRRGRRPDPLPSMRSEKKRKAAVKRALEQLAKMGCVPR